MDRSLQIIQIIEKNPGIKFREIMRETGMQNGVLSYYTRKLEEKGVINIERSPRLTRYYPLGINKQEANLIKNLRQETPKNILIELLKDERHSFNEIVERVKRAPSTVSIYLTQLVQDGIIDSRYVNQKRTFEIKDKEVVLRLVDRYHPDILEKSADHISDIFSSL